jgi:hypothetical protein
MIAAALAACATAPAPITYGPDRGEGQPQTWARPPFDPNAPPQILSDEPPLQCVPFARLESGIDIYGDANTWWDQAAGRYPRSNLPAPGSVLVVRGYRNDTRGHVAVVAEIVSSRIIRVDHANWLNRGEISLNVPVLDVSRDNDWSEIRVWNIPTDEWGARVYLTRGFIHPFLLQAALN